MKLSTSSVFASLVASLCLVSAATIPTAGAVYFISNQPSGNFIVSADIANNGTLSFANAVSAGGRGGHISPDIAGSVDALNSQGSIRVSGAGNVLAAVNPGSNTVVLFAIDPQMPSKISMIGSPVPSGGDFPVSVAFDKSGDRVCVLNGGADCGVNCFSVDQKHGLTPIANSLRFIGLNQTTPPTLPTNASHTVIFSEDESKLIVFVTGDFAQTPPFLATWDVESDGSLSASFTKLPLPVIGQAAFGMTAIPGKNAVLVVDPTIGFDVFGFNGNNANATVTAVDGQLGTCWSSVSTRTGNFYLSDPFRSAVYEVHVDDNLHGTVVAEYPQKANTGSLDSDVAALADQDFLYVLSPGSLTIEAFVASAPGKLEHIQSFDFTPGAKRAGVTVDLPHSQGMAAYVKPT